MTKAEINEKLKALLEEEMNNHVLKEARDLRDQYQVAAATDRKEQLEKFTADGGEKEDFALKRDEDDEAFDELWLKLGQKEKVWREREAKNQEENLVKKTAILDRIKDITENEENIKNAFAAVKELENEWKETGSVPAPKFNEMQAEFSKVRDAFYYNMRIYKELFEHDLKRNLQHKEELAEKMEALIKNESIKETETLVKTYLKEWDEIGPTFKEEWEKVRDRFRGAQREVFDRIKEHYKQVRHRHMENLERKEKLCEKAEAVLEEDIKTTKRWNILTDEFKSLQKEWKSIGFAPKEKNEEIWQRFKKAGDQFFDRKSDFFKAVRAKQNEVRDIKKEYVRQAEELKDSEEWKEAAEKLKNLQRKWKNAGAASQRDEQKLWRKFRAACDHFFKRKKEFLAGKDDREAANLKKKNEIVEQINAFEAGDDKDADFEKVQKLVNEFNEIGFVPIKEKGDLMNRFRKATEKAYRQLGLSKEETRKLQFKNKLQDIQQGGNTQAFEREEQNLRDKIKELQATVTQYENNMEFFNISKGAESLKKEVEDKINRSKEELELNKEKLKMLRKTRS